MFSEVSLSIVKNISGAEMSEFIPVVLSQLIVIINRPKTPKTLLENTGMNL